MRVTLTPDGSGATRALVERDDGTVWAMRGPVVSPVCPHDAVHLVVERELGVPDGIWGTIADGGVYTTMTHVSGRRSPRAAERGREVVRARKERILAAEALAARVERVARGVDPPADDAEARAAAAVRATGEQWRRDGRLELEWTTPAGPRARRGAASPGASARRGRRR